MNPKLEKVFSDFRSEFWNAEEVKEERVIALLDEVKNFLSLEDIYVCECSASAYHFLYSYVTTGFNQRVMHFNVLIEEGDAYQNLLATFGEDRLGVVKENMKTHNYAMKPNNLLYGFVVEDRILGFISFQPKEEKHTWNNEKKEALSALASLLRFALFPDILRQEMKRKKTLDEKRARFLYYYPKLSLLIPSVRTRDEFEMSYYYRLSYPEEYAEKFVYYKDQKLYIDSVKKAIHENQPVTFVYREATHLTKIQETVVVNRFDNKGNPEEIISILEDNDENDEESKETKLRYEAFNVITNRDNLAEFYLEFSSDKVTVFKIPSYWENAGWLKRDSYSTGILAFIDEVVLPEDQERILKLFESENLRRTLMDKGHALTVEFQGLLNGKEKWLRLEAIPGTNGGHAILSNAILLLNDVTEELLHRNDLLTGLLGKEKMLLLIQQKEEEIKETKKAENWSIFYINVLRFKLFNRYFGKENGDIYLKRVALTLSRIFPTASLSRFSDDHFVLLDNLPPEEMEKRLGEAETSLREENGNYSLPLHAGIYRLAKEETLFPLAMCDASKMACDQIASLPNVHVYLYSEELAEKEIRSRYLLDHLDQAIEDGEIEVYYQPVIRSLTGKVTSLEALVRWNNPRYGFLNPALFIPLLEEYSLCWKIDCFVLEKTASYMDERRKDGKELLPISLNLSRTDLAVKDFPEFLEGIVTEYHLPKNLFEIEITESAMVKEPSLLKTTIDAFHEKGYLVWMDDFGSGYSSLNSLHDYSFDLIKFDLVFLKNFTESSEVILSSCVDMVKKLHIHTLAEGAETEEQVEFLKSIGVEKIQGYYYSKPLPSSQLTEKIENHTFNLETEEEREAMDKIGSVNVLASLPLVFFKSDKEGLKIFFTNDAFQGLFGKGSLSELEKLLAEEGFSSSSTAFPKETTSVYQGKEVIFSLVEAVPYEEGCIGALSFSLAERKEKEE